MNTKQADTRQSMICERRDRHLIASLLALPSHRTSEEMQRHYSNVGTDEKRAAVAGVLRLVPPEAASNPTPPGTPPSVGESGRKTASGGSVSTRQVSY